MFNIIGFLALEGHESSATIWSFFGGFQSPILCLYGYNRINFANFQTKRAPDTHKDEKSRRKRSEHEI